MVCIFDIVYNSWFWQGECFSVEHNSLFPLKCMITGVQTMASFMWFCLFSLSADSVNQHRLLLLPFLWPCLGQSALSRCWSHFKFCLFLPVSEKITCIIFCCLTFQMLIDKKIMLCLVVFSFWLCLQEYQRLDLLTCGPRNRVQCCDDQLEGLRHTYRFMAWNSCF